MVVAVTEEDIREDSPEDTAVFLVGISAASPDAAFPVASPAAGDWAAGERRSAVSGALAEGAIGGAIAARGATVPMEAMAADTTGATLQDTPTVGTTTREDITEVIPGTITGDGLPMVQHSGSSPAG